MELRNLLLTNIHPFTETPGYKVTLCRVQNIYSRTQPFVYKTHYSVTVKK